MRRAVVALFALALLSSPVCAANVWEATTIAVGVQGAWYNSSDNGDLEAAANAALGITPHIAVVAGLDYGFSHTYLREWVGARVTATDVNDPTFSVGFGASRHFRSEPGGLEEWAGEMAVGWQPMPGHSLTFTLLGAYGIDTHNPFVTAGVKWPLKISSGGQ